MELKKKKKKLSEAPVSWKKRFDFETTISALNRKRVLSALPLKATHFTLIPAGSFVLIVSWGHNLQPKAAEKEVPGRKKASDIIAKKLKEGTLHMVGNKRTASNDMLLVVILTKISS